MELPEIGLLGVALSLDSFAVSLSLGVVSRRSTRREKIRFLLIIGCFHWLMIVGGWLLGEQLNQLIAIYSPWIAALLLTFLGGKMIKEGASEKNDQGEGRSRLLSLKNTLTLGIALSIDALVAGFSLGLVRVSLVNGSPCANILVAGAIVGCSAMLLATLAMLIGKRASNRLGARAELFGGIILILIGLNVLLGHLFT